MDYLKAIIIFFLFSTRVSAQEMWGISNSNFSGNMGIQLNPSTIVAAPYKYELHYFSMDLFAQNNYIFLPAKANVIANGITGKLGSEKNFYDLFRDDPQSGFGHVDVIGPSFIYNNGHRAWGIHTAFRNELSALDVPTPVAKYIYEKYRFKPFVNKSFSSNPFSVAYMSWAELGGTYGKVLIEKERDFLKAAITGNVLFGFDGLYLDARKFDYTILDNSAVIIHSMDATIAHAVDQNGNADFGNIVKLRGFGISTTLGATYIRHRRRGAFDCNNTADNFKKYKYRVGLSLMDFGLIRFSNQAHVLEVGTQIDRLWSNLDTIKFSSFSHLDEILSNHVNGTAGSVENKSFAMFLPSAISIQFDYSFTPHVYGNISWLNRIHYSVQEVARGNQVDASVRYEKKKWEAAADFTLFEYNQPAVGISLRHSFFVIGTDRLLEWLSVTDIRSVDLFFGFKANLCDFKKKSKVFCPAIN